jgi:hypothetical protein
MIETAMVGLDGVFNAASALDGKVPYPRTAPRIERQIIRAALGAHKFHIRHGDCKNIDLSQCAQGPDLSERKHSHLSRDHNESDRKLDLDANNQGRFACGQSS